MRSPQPSSPGSGHFLVSADHDGSRLDAFVAAVLPQYGARGAKRLSNAGHVSVNGKARKAQFRLEAGMRVTVTPPPAPGDTNELFLGGVALPYAFFIKPANLHSAKIAASSGPSLEESIEQTWHGRFASRPFIAPASPVQTDFGTAMMERLVQCAPPPPEISSSEASEVVLPQNPPTLLSRLDSATSGIVPAAFGEAAPKAFRVAEEAGSVDKYYFAVVHGLPGNILVDNALDTDTRKKTRVLAKADPDPARHTAVFPLAPYDMAPGLPSSPLTLVAARIHRGARHQIRAHLAHAGFPLLGDALYGQDAPGALVHLHHALMVSPFFTAAVPPPWRGWHTADG